MTPDHVDPAGRDTLPPVQTLPRAGAVNALPMRRTVLGLIASAIVVGCSPTPERQPDPEAASEWQEELARREAAIERTRESGPRVQESMAEAWAESGIGGRLGMRDTEFFSQMPDGNEITAAWSQSGVNRIHTMTWSDGSQVVTYWRPSDTPGDGLRLYMIDRIGFP